MWRRINCKNAHNRFCKIRGIQIAKMGWKDALQSVRAGPVGLYPGAHAWQGRSPPEGGDPPLRDQEEKASREVAACQPVRLEVYSGVNNVGNNVLLNLEVDPGEGEINSLLWVAVCKWPLTPSLCKTLFTNIMGNMTSLTPPPPNARKKSLGPGGQNWCL